MTSNWTSLFVAGSLLFVTTQIAAEEHAVLGQGNVSCSSWLNDRKGEDAAIAPLGDQSADPRRGAAHGGQLCQAAGTRDGADKRGVTRLQPHISR